MKRASPFRLGKVKTPKDTNATYCFVDGVAYKQDTWDSGFVRNSPHKVNEVYLQIGGMVLDLRVDEAQAICAMLSKTLWCLDMAKLVKYKGFKFKSVKYMKKHFWPYYKETK